MACGCRLHLAQERRQGQSKLAFNS